MATPLVETYAAAIVTQLSTITELANYEKDVAAVTRHLPRNGSPVSYSVYVIQGERKRSEQEPDNREQWVQNFELRCVVMPPDSGTGAVDTDANTLVADVHKCLEANNRSWATMLDGFVDFRIEGPVPIPPDEGMYGQILTLQLTYRHDRGNPFASED